MVVVVAPVGDGVISAELWLKQVPDATEAIASSITGSLLQRSSDSIAK